MGSLGKEAIEKKGRPGAPFKEKKRKTFIYFTFSHREENYEMLVLYLFGFSQHLETSLRGGKMPMPLPSLW